MITLLVILIVLTIIVCFSWLYVDYKWFRKEKLRIPMVDVVIYAFIALISIIILLAFIHMVVNIEWR